MRVSPLQRPPSRRAPALWRWSIIAVTSTALLLALLNSVPAADDNNDALEQKLAMVRQVAMQRQHAAVVQTSQLDGLSEDGDNGVAVAAVVKDAIGAKSEEGENLSDADYGAPDDVAAVEAVQEAVKAEADAEVDEAVANSKQAAATDYVAARSDFMTQEAAEPNGGVGGIIAMEGEPGHPANYARSQPRRSTAAQQQHRAYGPPAPAASKTKLVEKPAEFKEAFDVEVPAGLKAGEQFVANIPAHGRMLVTVPRDVSAGQTVQIEAPFALPEATARPATTPLATQARARVYHRALAVRPKIAAKSTHSMAAVQASLHAPTSSWSVGRADHAEGTNPHMDAGEALKAGVLQSEWHEVAHPEEGVTAIEAQLMKQAERMIIRTRDRAIKAKQSNSFASELSLDRQGLVARLHTMALSYLADQQKAIKDGNHDAAQEDAEYQKAIHDLLGRIEKNGVPKNLPSYDGIVHQIPDKKNGADQNWRRQVPSRDKWADSVPKAGVMDEWKKDVQKGLDSWRKTSDDLKNKDIANISDDQWKSMNGAAKKDLGAALEKHADADSWSKQMRKALDGARQDRENDAARKAPQVAPDSLTDEIPTDCGPVKGAKIGAVRVFKGIPYAMPPTGTLRWAPPMARNAMSASGVPMGGCWAGTLMATSFSKVNPPRSTP